MLNGTYTALSGEPKTNDELFNNWLDKYRYFLLADFRVAMKHDEYTEDEFEKFLSFEWQYHIQELDELNIQFANGDI